MRISNLVGVLISCNDSTITVTSQTIKCQRQEIPVMNAVLKLQKGPYTVSAIRASHLTCSLKTSDHFDVFSFLRGD